MAAENNDSLPPLLDWTQGPLPIIDPQNDYRNHEIGYLFYPGKLGCASWMISSVILSGVGIYAGRELFDNSSRLVDVFIILGALSVGPLINVSTVFHLDLEHYGWERDHFHLSAIPITVWNVVARGINQILAPSPDPSDKIRKPWL